jgi:hypothetical protein
MSQIKVVNSSSEAVRVAIYKRPVLRPNLGVIAWRIVEPPPNGGSSVINIPNDYQIFANYSYDKNERNNPDAGNTTNVITFADYTSRFLVTSVTSQDQRANAATLEQTFTELAMNEVHIDNEFNYGVWCHITKEGLDIYAPQVVWPGGSLMEDIRSTFYLAVVAQFVSDGDRLVDEEISLTETQLLEGGAVEVTGSMWEGYAISPKVA